jgi:16S rRNA (cytosine967-C5)-methyltransferase
MIPFLDPLIEGEEIAALLERAPLDVRINRLKADRQTAQAALANATPTPLAPWGLRLPEGTSVEEVWKEGLVDVQDEGSQLVALACKAAPGMAALDLCAGAGGKTLALAADMENSGQILASDVDRGRLSRLTPRAERAGATIIEPRLLNPKTEGKQLADWRRKADIVLIDAPCSGSGTWRRNPETRWRLTTERLERLTKLQAQLLDLATELVRPGGHLVYAVCSILGAEGRAQAEALGERRSSLVPEDPAIGGGRSCGPGTLLTPGRDGTDGFFVARWQVPC